MLVAVLGNAFLAGEYPLEPGSHTTDEIVGCVRVLMGDSPDAHLYHQKTKRQDEIYQIASGAAPQPNRGREPCNGKKVSHRSRKIFLDERTGQDEGSKDGSRHNSQGADDLPDHARIERLESTDISRTTDHGDPGCISMAQPIAAILRHESRFYRAQDWVRHTIVKMLPPLAAEGYEEFPIVGIVVMQGGRPCEGVVSGVGHLHVLTQGRGIDQGVANVF